jgi:hypothetical protein
MAIETQITFYFDLFNFEFLFLAIYLASKKI